MKKSIIIILCAITASFGVVAQDSVTVQKAHVVSKQYLPEKGDFSVGIGAIPFLDYLGNLLNGYGTNGTKNTINSPIGGGVINLDIAPKPTVSMMGKYFIEDKLALRFNIGAVSTNTFQKEYVTSDELAVTDPTSSEKLIDCAKTYSTGFIFTGGIEKRLGKSRRIQGILGADLLFAGQTSSIEYEYANKLTTLNTKPTTASIMPAADASGYRTLKKLNGNNYYAGGLLSVGVEYFIVPKLAIGSEVNMMVYYKFGSSVYDVREGLNQYTNAIEQRTILTSPGNSSFTIGTDNFVTKLYLSFYF